MKPVMQTVFGPPNGNCFQACVASMLELPLSQVPEFRRIQTDTYKCMVTECDNWLREALGLRFVGFEMFNEDGEPITNVRLCNRVFCQNSDFAILSGESPRKTPDGKTMYHCVIGKPQIWGFKVEHDPHPEGGGIIGEPYGVKWIVKL